MEFGGEKKLYSDDSFISPINIPATAGTDHLLHENPQKTANEEDATPKVTDTDLLPRSGSTTRSGVSASDTVSRSVSSNSVIAGVLSRKESKKPQSDSSAADKKQ